MLNFQYPLEIVDTPLGRITFPNDPPYRGCPLLMTLFHSLMTTKYLGLVISTYVSISKE